MRWPSFWSSSKDEKSDRDSSAQSPGEILDSLFDTEKPPNSAPATSTSSKPLDWSWRAYTEPQTIVATVALTSACIGFYKFYRTFLHRIPAAGNISPAFFRKRSVFGQVTSVGDGDNFRIFHTPGGWLAGWGWWRPIPLEKKALKNNTVWLHNFESLDELEADSVVLSDPCSISRDRCTRSCPFRSTIPAIFTGSTWLADLLCSRSPSQSLCVQARSIPTSCCDSLRTERAVEARCWTPDVKSGLGNCIRG